jgi:hypothetical protein
MPFPPTRDELIAAGYRFSEHARCRGEDCQREIEWWKTKDGKAMPIDLMLDGTSKPVPHWTTCPNANDFRRNKKNEDRGKIR